MIDGKLVSLLLRQNNRKRHYTYFESSHGSHLLWRCLLALLNVRKHLAWSGGLVAGIILCGSCLIVNSTKIMFRLHSDGSVETYCLLALQVRL